MDSSSKIMANDEESFFMHSSRDHKFTSKTAISLKIQEEQAHV